MLALIGTAAPSARALVSRLCQAGRGGEPPESVDRMPEPRCGPAARPEKPLWAPDHRRGALGGSAPTRRYARIVILYGVARRWRFMTAFLPTRRPVGLERLRIQERYPVKLGQLTGPRAKRTRQPGQARAIYVSCCTRMAVPLICHSPHGAVPGSAFEKMATTWSPLYGIEP
jgi:hypothetical protein